MIKVLLSALSAIILAILAVTFWYLFFGPNGVSALLSEYLLVARSNDYWLGIGIFSLLFFGFFTLPLSFVAVNKQK